MTDTTGLEHRIGLPYGLRDHCPACDARQQQQAAGLACSGCGRSGVPMVTVVRLESLIPWRTIRVARCAPGHGCAEKTARHAKARRVL